MATVSFKDVSSKDKVTADNSDSIANGISPFQHGVQFTISDWNYVRRNGDDNKRDHAIFTTSVGNLFLSTVRAEKVAANGEPVENDGSFNILVKNIFREHLAKKNPDGSSAFNNGTFMKAIVDAVNGKTITVRRIPYNALSRDGKTVYSASIVCLDC